jgi:hypothetical protein
MRKALFCGIIFLFIAGCEYGDNPQMPRDNDEFYEALVNVKEAAKTLEIGLSGGDYYDSGNNEYVLIQNITLPEKALYNYDVNWRSSDEGVVDLNGTVTRQIGDVVVLLRAYVKEPGGLTASKTFYLLVKSL